MPVDFIRKIIQKDSENKNLKGQVTTRFPPEPNGYLHIGHAKSICLNFGIANEYKGGKCNLRFDDTNPDKEDTLFVEAIKEDIKWLGYDWGERTYFASDYFDKLYNFAVRLIEKGKAYVCDLNAEEIRKYRGTLTMPGVESPYRKRTMNENLELFASMKDGKFANGSCILRAKIDMASPNLNMRDPTIYRIRKMSHHRTGDRWCIYPTYDFTHGLSDYLEGVTHSLCTLEFEDHRPLYDWILAELDLKYPPKQIEFARLNINNTVTSKRKLKELVEKGYVTGWNDPRMPTLTAMKRRGYTPTSIREFCTRIGVTKEGGIVDFALLNFCLREELNKIAPRVMAVLKPLKVIIDNYPQDKTEYLDIKNNPEDPASGTRKVPFEREIYIEQDDFQEEPQKKFYRLSIGREVRLLHAYYIKCENIIKNKDTGEITILHCTYDPRTRGGWSQDGRRVKGTLHWVAAHNKFQAKVRLYENLFIKNSPHEGNQLDDGEIDINPNSLIQLSGCLMENSLKKAQIGQRFQFLRIGYYCVDSVDSKDGEPVFNRITDIKDSFKKIEKKIN